MKLMIFKSYKETKACMFKIKFKIRKLIKKIQK